MRALLLLVPLHYNLEFERCWHMWLQVTAIPLFSVASADHLRTESCFLLPWFEAMNIFGIASWYRDAFFPLISHFSGTHTKMGLIL